MTREEAIKIIRDTYHTDEEMKALESLIPELRETEDERIRKKLYNTVMGTPNDSTWFDGTSKDAMLAWLKKQKEQKPAEDKYQQELEATDRWQEGYEAGYNAASRPAWSKEDEKMLDDICSHLYATPEERDKLQKWLKSLRPGWKPTEAQMNALNFAITYFMHETNYKNPTELRDLYEQLKKL